MMKLKPHPLAEKFPPMGEAEFAKLVADVRKKGQVAPIILDGDVILDGLHRLRACRKAKIVPNFKQFRELMLSCSPEDFIWSANVERRHMSKPQLVSLALEFPKLRKKIEALRRTAKAKQGRQHFSQSLEKAPAPNFGIKTIVHRQEHVISEFVRTPLSTSAEIGKQLGASHGTVDAVLRVDRHDPELRKAIGRGELTLRDAEEQIAESPKKLKRFDPDAAAERAVMRLKQIVENDWEGHSKRPLIRRVRQFLDELECAEAVVIEATEKIQ